MQKIDGERITIVMPYELLDEVDRIAKRCKLTRSEMIRNMLDISSGLYRKYEAVGFVKFYEMTEKLKETVNRSVGQQQLFKSE
jgi:hypothetical protein